jgi:hypothetical protein
MTHCHGTRPSNQVPANLLRERLAIDNPLSRAELPNGPASRAAPSAFCHVRSDRVRKAMAVIERDEPEVGCEQALAHHDRLPMRFELGRTLLMDREGPPRDFQALHTGHLERAHKHGRASRHSDRHKV